MVEMASRPSKRRKLTPPPSDDDHASTAKVQKAFFKNAASWNLEQDYENRPRKGKKDKESSRLPIKTADGHIQHVAPLRDDVVSIDSDAEWLEGGEEDVDEPETDEKPQEQPKIPEREQILRAQEELAKIGSQLNEEPEENPGAFKALAKLGESNIPAIKKLCLATQMAVYKDVIPMYRIRPQSEDVSGEKLSKEVRRVRAYEQALVFGYQAYIKELAKLVKVSRGDKMAQSIASVAITCACNLLKAVPHFNFRGDLLRILVGKLSHRRVDEDFVKCREALEILFREDEDGGSSMEAVSLLSKMIKARDYEVDESVLNTFLHLRLLSELSSRATNDDEDQHPTGSNGKRLKQKREFRTKRARKQLKEQKALAKDMATADAMVSYEERDRNQSETLKLVFATYFRILKARSPHLMGAVLEGLAKYSHLINQDFFGDLLEALKDLIRHSDEDAEETEEADDDEEDDNLTAVRNPSREALLCTVTAFALLAGQDAHNARTDLHLDLSYFTTHLFRSLLPLSVDADLELGAKSLHLPDPDSPEAAQRRSNKVNIQTMTVLLVRCLTAVLLPPWNIRSVPPLRLAAFTKQLMSIALHMPEKSCQAVLALVNDVTHTHGKKIGALWNTEERKGDGTYNPLSDSVEGSNPFATTVWEGEILRRHYCPKVREGVKILEKSIGSI
ncbi:putative nucleolar complex-associated protein 3 protein [Phaeoacremonium minimum UCRPA7]|uniref:Nucleolar complex-associated protein 3 n=1 Tax=Phaeoacremonium minimum (strain UCR-PA7) TaxID=1286976 RepID=R8BES7_PHAM7|nr:putative nucleolar complex-associated protein 3 protein [Phaeoacremonium minimum UCRPA7]EON97803.1 putative nucleolar complex-associated protein 3 protein [Phaeoacremonium minimum UCRPA7]